MESLEYQVEINASKAVVWNTLTNTGMYKKWVKAFSPNSYFVQMFEAAWPKALRSIKELSEASVGHVA